MNRSISQRWLGGAFLFLAAALAVPSLAAGTRGLGSRAEGLRGLSLTAVLQDLQDRGLPLVFSSKLVRPDMRVEREPAGSSPREILDAVLRPHGLRVVAGAGGRLVVVRAPSPVAAGVEAPPAQAPPSFAEEIVVTPEAGDPLREAAGAQSVVVLETDSGPYLANDVFRVVGGLPGTTMRESSSRVNVRGGREDDVLILLDGLELLEPYHLQEFDSALSIVAPTALERADLIPNGYTAEFGDRLGGVLDLTTTAPDAGRHLSFGLGLTHADVAGSGRFAGDRGTWYGAARGGSYRLALELGGRKANPRFWDAFAKVDVAPGATHTVRVSALVAEDELGVGRAAPDDQEYHAAWANRYAWLTHHWLLRPALAAETIASVGEIERRRSASKSEPDETFVIGDARSLRVAGIKQLWRYEPDGRFSGLGGLELRELGSNVDYFNRRRLGGALAPVRSQPAIGSTVFAGRFDFNQYAAFATARLRSDTLTSELGLRYDRDTFGDEAHLGPRFNAAWELAPRSVARLAWGWFYQSQRPNELQVEDDETQLYPAERAEHRVLQLEHQRPAGGALRIELFERRVSRSRPRFDNLFDPVSFFPELEDDRVRIAPSRAAARGVELSYRSGWARPAHWWLSYTFASSRETVGGRQVPAAVDQRHAVGAGLGYRTRQGWSFETAWTYHTGWPTTAVWARAVTDAEGTAIEPVLGPLNAERLPSYHRLDLRVARVWGLARGHLSTYVDLQNAYDRQNVRGRTDFFFLPDDAGGASVGSAWTTWGGLLPSFGLRWGF